MDDTIIQTVFLTSGVGMLIFAAAQTAYLAGHKRGSLLTGNYYRTRAREHVEKREQKTITYHTDGARTEDYYNHSVTSPQPEKD